MLNNNTDELMRLSLISAENIHQVIVIGCPTDLGGEGISNFYSEAFKKHPQGWLHQFLIQL